MARLTFAFLVTLLAAATAAAQTTDTDWLNFRGDVGNGVSASATPPTTWSDSENIAWKKKIPGNGSSSPIVVGNRVIITSAIPSAPDREIPKQLSRRELAAKLDEDGDGKLSKEERDKAIAYRAQEQKKLLQEHDFLVLCYDRSSGDLLWEKQAATGMPHEFPHSDHGYASASPVSDGEVVLINFGSQGLYCFDLEGNQRWKRDNLGKMKTRGTFGEGSSVAIDGDHVILPWDHEGQSRIEVINRSSGETIWKKDRDEPSNWVTPRIAEIDGRKQIVQVGQNYSRGYDLATGDELWKASGMSQRPVSTPALMDNIAFVSSARGGAVLQAIRLDQQGDISSTGIEWTVQSTHPISLRCCCLKIACF